MTRKRRRHNPPMMRLMQRLINQRMMQPAMNQINQPIRKHQEQRELRDHVPPPILLGVQVQFAVPADFGEKPWGGEDGHLGQRVHCQGDFLFDLAGEEARVGFVGFVKDEVVGQGGEDEVEDYAEHPLLVSYCD